MYPNSKYSMVIRAVGVPRGPGPYIRGSDAYDEVIQSK